MHFNLELPVAKYLADPASVGLRRQSTRVDDNLRSVMEKAKTLS